MKQSKKTPFIIGLAAIALITGIVFFHSNKQKDSDNSVKQLSSVNTEIDTTLPVLISMDYESNPEKGNPQKKKTYMSYTPDIYDPDVNYEDIAEHLTNESPNSFSDPYIKQKAQYYSSEPYNYNLVNAEYAAKYYGTGIGYGDYLFTEGFSFIINQEHIHITFDIVKSTSDELNDFIEEMTDKYNFIDIEEVTDTNSIICSFTGDNTRFDILYNYDKELLIQRTLFNN